MYFNLGKDDLAFRDGLGARKIASVLSQHTAVVA